MKTIAIGGFFHESNTFNPIITGVDDFFIFEGDAIFSQGHSYLLAKGMVDYFAPLEGYHILPLVFARAVPNGEVDFELYQILKARFFALLDAASAAPDLFLLPLHGSMRVQHIGSAETDLLQAIKAHYPHTPIVLGLDMHATITPQMLRLSNAITGFKTAPHTDAWETGIQAAKMAELILEGKHKLHMGSVKLPLLIAGEKSETDSSPMKELIAELHRLEQESKVCAASYLLGYPWADTSENGVTALVVCKDDPNAAARHARYLADRFRGVKHLFDFSSPAFEPSQALELALAENVRPVFVSDSGDNPTAGSTADNTTLAGILSTELQELTSRKKVLVAGIFDPIASAICKDNLNREISLEIGGRYDTRYCQPITLKGKPIKHIEGFGAYQSALSLFHTPAFDLIITSKHIGFTSPDIFTALQIDYLNTDLIVVKLGYLTPEFKAIAAKSYLALSPGCTNEVLSRLDYKHKYEML